MTEKQEEEGVRISFKVDKDLYERTSYIPWGVRAELLRVLLRKVIEAAESHGSMILGAILGGDFDIVHKKKEKKG